MPRPDPVQDRACRRDRGPPQARRASAVQGPLSRRADPGDARGRSVARQRPRRQCRRADARQGGAGAAGLSGRGQRDVPPGHAPRKRQRCARRASISTTGGRARSGWSPAGTSRAERASTALAARDRRACERRRTSGSDASATVTLPVHHLHRDLGLDLDRHPRPARHRPAAMVGHLSLRHRRARDGGGRAMEGREPAARPQAACSPRRSSASPSSASTSTRSISPSGTSPRASSRPCSRCC